MKGGTDEKTTLNLPQDLLIQILIRLPAKSLVSFKCVSKSWLSLISDLHFANLHYELAAATQARSRLVVLSTDASEIRSVDVNEPCLHDDSAFAVRKVNFLLPQPQDRPVIRGSCRGFLLLDCFPNFYMWNPTIDVHKQLPFPPRYYSSDCRCLIFLYGFGYDPSTHDYLIILVSFKTYLTVELFSFKSNTWKEWEGLCLPCVYSLKYFDSGVGLFFNGAIHWFAYHCNRMEYFIAVFDLIERTFSEISLPRGIGNNFDYSELRVFGGFLSICAPRSYNRTGGIWVMKEYKVESSWIKLNIVSPCEQLFPICRTKSGDILGIDPGTGLVIFNNKGEVQKYNYCRDFSSRLGVVVYE